MSQHIDAEARATPGDRSSAMALAAGAKRSKIAIRPTCCEMNSILPPHFIPAVVAITPSKSANGDYKFPRRIQHDSVNITRNTRVGSMIGSMRPALITPMCDRTTRMERG
jgi:hypothetical protein